MGQGGRSGHTILVVDDDATLRALTHELLRAEGYRVAVAATLDEALAALAHTRFSLILTDVSLAGAGTAERWAAVEHIRVAAGYTPVVLFTAYRDGDLARYAARGFADLVLKPFELDELLAVVRRHLAGKLAGQA